MRALYETHIEPLLNKHAKVGAGDTEPRSVLKWAIRSDIMLALTGERSPSF